MRSPLITTVDVVLLTLFRDKLHVVLMRRDKEPYPGQLALPGGYIHPDEDADSFASARRVLKEKTGIESPYLEQLYTFSSGARDPRGWSISIAYYALVNSRMLVQDSKGYELLPVDELPDLSFDHNKIIATAVQRVRDKSTYSTLPCYLLPETFTLTELQQTYEKVLGVKLNKGAFRRKVDNWDFIEPVEASVKTGSHRPAQYYQIKPTKHLQLFDRTVSNI